MQNAEFDFRGKKIGVIGAGVEGGSTVNYLVSKAANVSLLDEKTEKRLGSEKINQIKKLPVTTRFGKNYLLGLNEFDIIFRSPGIRRDLPEILAAEKAGVQITSQIKLFFDQCTAPIIGVTGTKGKGTTCSLIYEILRRARKKVFLGGNIGKAPLDFVDKLTPESWVVLELSSFQLTDLHKSPHIAVILMITSEHLDWHKGINEYRAAKEPIVKYQKGDDFVVINKDFSTSKKFGEGSAAQKYYFSTKEPVEKGAYIEKGFVVGVTNGWTTIAPAKEIKILGEHNLQNICAVTAVAGILEIPPEIISKVVTTFKGLPHRLEFVAQVHGVRYYDDSASTTPETGIAAIRAFRNPKILILGGSSKKSDFTLLGKTISDYNVKAVILIGKEAENIKRAIKSSNFTGKILGGAQNMKEIVSAAKDLAEEGDVILLSPACASLDMFENYVDRGNQFKKNVDALFFDLRKRT